MPYLPLMQSIWASIGLVAVAPALRVCFFVGSLAFAFWLNPVVPTLAFELRPHRAHHREQVWSGNEGVLAGAQLPREGKLVLLSPLWALIVGDFEPRGCKLATPVLLPFVVFRDLLDSLESKVLIRHHLQK